MRRLLRDRRGATSLEYGILAAAVCVYMATLTTAYFPAVVDYFDFVGNLVKAIEP